jgi:hypothetical protein
MLYRMPRYAQGIVEDFDNLDKIVKGIRQIYTGTTIIFLGG